MRLAAALAAALLLLSVSGCAMRDRVLRLVTPSGGAETYESLRYMPGERGTLDVYAPLDAADAPVVVFFYGGSWQDGRKALYGFVGNALAARGIVAVVPDYRVYPEVRFPTFLEDGAKAVSWAKDNAAEFGGDPDRLVVMGHSAGAHIAAMLALDGRWLAAEGIDPDRDVAALVGLSGPYDFLPLKRKDIIAVFGGANRPETQPVEFVTADAPPAFLAAGEDDTVVEPRNTTALAAALEDAGVPVRTKLYPSRGHVGTIAAFVGPLHFLAPSLADVADFVHRTAATPRTPR